MKEQGSKRTKKARFDPMTITNIQTGALVMGVQKAPVENDNKFHELQIQYSTVERYLRNNDCRREEKWSESVVVGDKNLVATTRQRLGHVAFYREEIRVKNEDDWYLKEPTVAYGP